MSPSEAPPNKSDWIRKLRSDPLFFVLCLVCSPVLLAQFACKQAVRFWRRRKYWWDRFLIRCVGHPAHWKKRTPFAQTLLRAIVRNDLDTVSTLLQSGVSADTETEDGISALHLAVRYRRYEVAHRLLEAGANPEARYPLNGETALIRATKLSDARMVWLLLDSGAKVEACGFSGLTALMYAATYGYCEVARILLESGANPHRMTPDGRSARTYARLSNRNNVANLFEQRAG